PQLSDVIEAGGAATIDGTPPVYGQQRCWTVAISSWAHPRIPTSPAPVSEMWSFQVPLISFPLNVESATCGLNEPEKGAAPPAIEPAAESSNTVWAPEQSLAPVP